MFGNVTALEGLRSIALRTGRTWHVSDPGFGFWGSGLRFRVSGCGFQNSGTLRVVHLGRSTCHAMRGRGD